MARVLKISQFYLHTHTFIRNRNEPYLPLPSQLWLVLIYRPRRDGKQHPTFLQLGCPYCRPTNSVRALEGLAEVKTEPHQPERCAHLPLNDDGKRRDGIDFDDDGIGP